MSVTQTIYGFLKLDHLSGFMNSPSLSTSADLDRGVYCSQPPGSVVIRKAGLVDLRPVNKLIADAMSTWRLAARVKRISLPLYQYQTDDFEQLQIIVAEADSLGVVGVASIDTVGITDSPGGLNAGLLHGLYIDPRQHRGGLGTCLLERIEGIAAAEGLDGLLVKAQREAVAFFESRGFNKLPVVDHSRDYPHRYWKPF